MCFKMVTLWIVIAGGNEDGHFDINARTGELSCTDLDRETKASYNLTVSAADAGKPPKQSFCQVHLSLESHILFLSMDKV